ncbi:MAG: hypothetical protein JWQ49_4330 [Edaphobacter sp.]|nr:hypothetical protein [Edaphobacter sp.]
MDQRTKLPMAIHGDFKRESSSPIRPLARTSAGNVLAGNGVGEDLFGADIVERVRNLRKSDDAYLHRDRSWWDRLTGRETARDKRIEQHDLAQTEQICKFLERKLGLECEALYLRLNDDVNGWLARHRIAARSELIEFATRQLQELKQTLEERRRQYNDLVRVRVNRLQANSDLELLVDAEVRDLTTELDEHLDFLRQLESLFRAAIMERIG